MQFQDLSASRIYRSQLEVVQVRHLELQLEELTISNRYLHRGFFLDIGWTWPRNQGSPNSVHLK